jgi:hypothetical protein
VYPCETTAPGPLPDVANPHLPELENLCLWLGGRQKVKWNTIEALTSLSVMPRLRHCVLDYDLEMDTDIRRIFASPLFGNDARRVHLRFLLDINEEILSLSSNDDHISRVRSGRYNEIYHQCVSSSSFQQMILVFSL